MLKEKKLHIHLKNIALPRKQKNKKNHNEFVILEKQILFGNFFKLRLTVVFIADTNIMIVIMNVDIFVSTKPKAVKLSGVNDAVPEVVMVPANSNYRGKKKWINFWTRHIRKALVMG